MNREEKLTRITEGTSLVTVDLEKIENIVEDILTESSGVVGLMMDIQELHIRFEEMKSELEQLYSDERGIWASPNISDGARSFNFGRLSLLEDLLNIKKKKVDRTDEQ